MFRNRASSARPSGDLLASFRRQFPEAAVPQASKPAVRISTGHDNAQERLFQVLSQDQPPPKAAGGSLNNATKRKSTQQQPDDARQSKRFRSETVIPSLQFEVTDRPGQIPSTTDDQLPSDCPCPLPSSKTSCATRHKYLTKLLQHLIRDHHFITGPKGSSRRKWLALFDLDDDGSESRGPVLCLGCYQPCNDATAFRYHDKRHCVRHKKPLSLVSIAIRDTFAHLAPRGTDASTTAPAERPEAVAPGLVQRELTWQQLLAPDMGTLAFPNAMPGYYTPTPGGTNTIYSTLPPTSITERTPNEEQAGTAEASPPSTAAKTREREASTTTSRQYASILRRMLLIHLDAFVNGQMIEPRFRKLIQACSLSEIDDLRHLASAGQPSVRLGNFLAHVRENAGH